MNYTKSNEGISIENDGGFDIKNILSCGQVFRYRISGDGCEVISHRHKAKICSSSKSNTVITTNNADYFEKYFDLETDYDIITANLLREGIMERALDFGRGLRILRQDRFETIISFIISANNNISRIRGIIERLCDALGEDMGGYRAFPTAEAMAEKDADFYFGLGAGYRADYLVKTARAITDGYDINIIGSMNGQEAAKYLQSLSGVGSKVADCILLFAYYKQDVFPVDTWVRKIAKQYFGIEEQNPKDIRKKLIDLYGGASGYAQQYLFYYKRELDRKNNERE